MCAWSCRGGIEARRCGGCVALLCPGDAASPRRLETNGGYPPAAPPADILRSAGAGKCPCCPAQPLSRPGGRKRSNTLDFASKAVRQQGAPAPVG